jgi:large subunit ribosomal protein L10
MPAEWKKQMVAEVVEDIKAHEIVGVVDLASMPLRQLQIMRSSLRGKVIIRGGRKKLFAHAIGKAAQDNPELGKLAEKLECPQPGMIFSKDNPFLLFKTLEKSKSPAPAKAGQKAPNDIVVPAGPTGFAPGPIIAELGDVGVKAGVVDGKIAVKADSLVAKEGDVITDKLAAVLTRLGINPMEIGLNLVAAYEDGFIFDKKTLAIDEKEYISNLETASSWAFNLAMNAGILTKETTELMISKAFNEAKALAISENIITKETAEALLAKANAEMSSLKGTANL